MYQKKHLEVAKFVADKINKDYLHTVKLEGNQISACDGFAAIKYVIKNTEQHSPKYVTGESIKKYVTLDKKEKISTNELTAIRNVSTVDVEKYPDTTELFEAVEKVETVTLKLNGKKLAKLLAAVSDINQYNAVTIKIKREIGGRVLPILIQTDGDGDYKNTTAQALLMPMNK